MYELKFFATDDADWAQRVDLINDTTNLPLETTGVLFELEVAEQKRWVRNLKAPSGAAGRYQIIRPTLLGLIEELGVPLSAKFSPDLQDRFGFALLKRRGWDGLAATKMPLRSFGNNLAMEWASFLVLSDQQGAHRPVKRGESYYAGDGINASLTKASNAEAAGGSAERVEPLAGRSDRGAD